MQAITSPACLVDSQDTNSDNPPSDDDEPDTEEFESFIDTTAELSTSATTTSDSYLLSPSTEEQGSRLHPGETSLSGAPHRPAEEEQPKSSQDEVNIRLSF